MPDKPYSSKTSLIAYQLTYQLPNGLSLFTELNFSLPAGITGLVGRNGCGKSILARLLAGEIKPGSGHVDYGGMSPDRIGYFSQVDDALSEASTSIADYLGLTDKLRALGEIEQGSCEPCWFERLADDWQIRERLNEQLSQLNLPQHPSRPLSQLSGGQQTRLRLWNIFRQPEAFSLLILDEPSNHLDQQGRRWLMAQLKAFQGAVLLVSHDFTLLNQMDRIWELDRNGITEYGGNFDFYRKEKAAQRSAILNEQKDLEKVIKKQSAEHQKNLEKAQQKAAQGNRLRKSGSQSKLILDAKKEKAGGHLKSLSRRQEVRDAQLNGQKKQLRQRLPDETEIRISLNGFSSHTGGLASVKAPGKPQKLLARLIRYRLPRGSDQPISLQISSRDRIYLRGSNGSGKSTLFKLLAGLLLDEPDQTVEVHPDHPDKAQTFYSHYSAFCYLDQHFNLLNNTASLLEQVQKARPALTEAEARTLLATIGFRRERVFQRSGELSGGEKMRLALQLLSLRNQNNVTGAFLLLDEPDNHLDLAAKELLAQALVDYRGGFALITHDEGFAQACGAQRECQLSLQ